MQTFRDFYNNKATEKLKIIYDVLKDDFVIKKHLKNKDDDDDDSYIFIENPDKNTSFDGIRVYMLGNNVYYRVQRKEKTHPYGDGYKLDLDSIFMDLKDDDDVSDEDLPKELKKAIKKKIETFFKKSSKFEKQGDVVSRDEGGLGQISVRNPNGGDYSSMVHELDRR